mmetsp:Transcript_31832/g.73128  ORF Transcript_31832/g.73128 Transcript_31832/m.73128 type:complete len:356 (+) Transcript_31832:187-1254(+)|eukprot:CAMPEP_0116855854 /NCGR_PEP_ID=MMETSP0418-20121206/19543_1 /TAXON_ID=1158023 /ORGANISM="Astrosyne radiata, Strain 13vi08-1A" /LENGTH=355 /DNA_ID=CAMNT_0004489101 /DNA_START=157 /DNA_END=1224 /DNA_ORIENTATION=-
MSSSDPNGFITNPPSTVVKVQNTSRDDVNGLLGIAITFQVDKGRYLVHMVVSQTTMSLKPDHLVKASMMESAQAQWEHAKRDPNLQRQLSRYTRLCKERLGVTPQVAGGIALVSLLLGCWFLGISYTFLLMSLLLMVLIVIGPDVMESGWNARIMMQNFPRRCRETIDSGFPIARGKFTDKTACVIMLFMWGLGLYILFGSALFGTSAKTAATMAKTAAAPQSTAVTATTKKLLEEAYKKGFEDASNELDYGTSLEELTKQMLKDSKSPHRDLLTEDGVPTDYSAPPPPKKSSSSFGMSQAISVFYLYRTISELGMDAGTFSTQALIANLRTLEPWKLGLAGLSIYNLLRPVLGW